jgi:hypothetical protein
MAFLAARLLQQSPIVVKTPIRRVRGMQSQLKMSCTPSSIHRITRHGNLLVPAIAINFPSITSTMKSTFLYLKAQKQSAINSKGCSQQNETLGKAKLETLFSCLSRDLKESTPAVDRWYMCCKCARPLTESHGMSPITNSLESLKHNPNHHAICSSQKIKLAQEWQMPSCSHDITSTFVQYTELSSVVRIMRSK